MENSRKSFLVLVFLLLMLIAMGIMFMTMMQQKKSYKNLLAQVASYQLKEKEFETKRLKDSSTIASQSQTILTQREAFKLGLIELNGQIKKLQSQVKQVQEWAAQGIDVPYVPKGYADTTGWMAKLNAGDTSKAVIDSLRANSIIVPKDFEYKSKWFNVKGTVKKNSVFIDSLSMSNESSVTIGYKKSGFLNLKKEPIVEIQNTNPYIQVKAMNNVVIKDKKGLFERKGFWFSLGAALTAALSFL